jgi:hypothetical protein
MAWNQVGRFWFDDVAGKLVFQYDKQLPPEQYDAIAPPYERYEVVVHSGLVATKIGEHHFGSWDEEIPQTHQGRCDGQPPA